MESILDTAREERAEREAAEWIARFDSGSLTDRQRGEFERWLGAEPLHARMFEEVGAVWKQMDSLQPANAPPEATQGRRSGASWPRGLAASVLVLGLAGAVTAFVFREIGTESTSLATQLGEHRRVRLDDGSVVTLNTSSRLEVRYSGALRELSLLRGEAYFDVAPDVRRPFVVRAGDGAVRAIGTAFGVKYAEADAVEVTVSQGRVQISAGTASSLPAAVDAARDDVTGLGVLAALDAGQRVRFDDRIRSVEPVNRREIADQLAWREGMLSLDGKTLGEAVLEFCRYTDIEILIEDPKLREQQVGGYFELGDTRALLSALEGNFGLESRLDGPQQVYLEPSRR